jgi:two-component system, NarL family, invasion response regulator UvrY
METKNTYSVGIADDHHVMRQGLAMLINSFGGFSVMFESADGAQVMEQLQAGNVPDLILLDQNMPEIDGHATAKYIRQYYPTIRVLVLSMYDTDSFLIRLLNAGARGFIRKDAEPAELKQAMQTVIREGFYHSNNTAGRITTTYRSPLRDELLGKRTLSDQEIEFLKLITSEATYKAIAAVMCIPMRSLDTIRDNLFIRLGVKNRVGLAMYAIRSGIVYI